MARIIERYHIEVEGIRIEVQRKDIKRMHLAISSSDGRVRLSAPLRVDDKTLRRVVASKLDWIKRHQARVKENPAPIRKKFISGEIHYFQGIPHRLVLVERRGNSRVVLHKDRTIELFVSPRSTITKRRQVLDNWYRANLKKAIPPVIKKWEKVMGVEVAEWGIKKMRTRWGSCNSRAHRIWLNLELAKRSPQCLEYVVVHELAHLLENSHNKRFKGFMDQFLPGWRSIRKQLKGSPL